MVELKWDVAGVLAVICHLDDARFASVLRSQRKAGKDLDHLTTSLLAGTTQRWEALAIWTSLPVQKPTSLPDFEPTVAYRQ